MPYTPFTMKTRGMIITDRIRAALIDAHPGQLTDDLTPGDRHDKLRKKLNSPAYLTIHDLGDILAAYTFYDAYLAAIGRGGEKTMTLNEIKAWGRRTMKRYITWAKAGYF